VWIVINLNDKGTGEWNRARSFEGLMYAELSCNGRVVARRMGREVVGGQGQAVVRRIDGAGGIMETWGRVKRGRVCEVG
jgi:hypothetical protein